MISAEVIADSISEQGKRLTTFKLRYPKFIHGEFMTHRVISRNASSSRAVPTAKLIEEVRSDALRAGPVFWGANQKGMQAAKELDDEACCHKNPYMPYNEPITQLKYAQVLWDRAARDAADLAEEMMQIGVHKQIVNRLLEPFSHINVVATATEWDNFFGLRLHKDAQPEMRALALAMWQAREGSEPSLLRPGDWHLPFVDVGDYAATGYLREEEQNNKLLRVSVARCARVSYESFDTGKRSTVEEDLKLYDRLLGSQPLHASPAEHQATPDRRMPSAFIDGQEFVNKRWEYEHEWGNLVGWRQYRKMLPNEAVAPLLEGF